MGVILMNTTSQMELVSIDKLVPYINNARTHSPAQITKLRSSLREFGFVNPIIVDRDFNIIAGHGRYEAAKAEGFTEVPCVYADFLTPAQRKAYILADNRMAEDAGWDEELLKIEIESLQAADFDVSLTGFDEDEISKFFDKDNEAKDDDFDGAEPLPENPYSIRGDIYILGKHKLMCGDSTIKEDVDKLMDGKQADMIFTDPPYNVNIGSKGKLYKERGGYNSGFDERSILNDNMDDASFKEFLKKVFDNFYTNVKEGGSIYVFHSDTEGLNFRSAFQNAGFKLSECLVWVKNCLVLGRCDYHFIHEPILYGWKPGAGHYFVDDRTQTTVWNFDRPKASELHPTTKPIPLVSKAITNSSLKDHLVLDLFGGSGSTLIAAEQTGRCSNLMELDPKYVDVIVKRYLRYKKGYEDCYLIRNGVQTPLKDIEELQISFDEPAM